MIGSKPVGGLYLGGVHKSVESDSETLLDALTLELDSPSAESSIDATPFPPDLPRFWTVASFYRTNTAGRRFAQRFRPLTTFTEDTLILDLTTLGTPPDIEVSIQSSSGSLPSGTKLASKTFTPTNGLNLITFDAPVTLSEGQTYWIVKEDVTTGSDTDYVGWDYMAQESDTGTLPGWSTGTFDYTKDFRLAAWYWNNTVWQVVPSRGPFAFKFGEISQVTSGFGLSIEVYDETERGQQLRIFESLTFETLTTMARSVGSPPSGLSWRITTSNPATLVASGDFSSVPSTYGLITSTAPEPVELEPGLYYLMFYTTGGDAENRYDVQSLWNDATLSGQMTNYNHGGRGSMMAYRTSSAASSYSLFTNSDIPFAFDYVQHTSTADAITLVFSAPSAASTLQGELVSTASPQELVLSPPDLSTSTSEELATTTSSLELSLTVSAASVVAGLLHSSASPGTLEISAPAATSSTVGEIDSQGGLQTVTLDQPDATSTLVGLLQGELSAQTLAIGGELQSDVGLDSKASPSAITLTLPDAGSTVVGELASDASALELALTAPDPLSLIQSSGASILTPQEITLFAPAAASSMTGNLVSQAESVSLTLANPQASAENIELLQTSAGEQSLTLTAPTAQSSLVGSLTQSLESLEVSLAAPTAVSMVSQEGVSVLPPQELALTAPTASSMLVGQVVSVMTPQALELSNRAESTAADATAIEMVLETLTLTIAVSASSAVRSSDCEKQLFRPRRPLASRGDSLISGESRLISRRSRVFARGSNLYENGFCRPGE